MWQNKYVCLFSFVFLNFYLIRKVFEVSSLYHHHFITIIAFLRGSAIQCYAYTRVILFTIRLLGPVWFIIPPTEH
jgi:hypothetical protein